MVDLFCLWMIISFVSVIDCRMDGLTKLLSFIYDDTYEFHYVLNILIYFVHVLSSNALPMLEYKLWLLSCFLV